MGDEGQVRLDPEMEEALPNATMKDIMELADILNTNPQDFVMEAYADPLQYFEPDKPNDVKPEEVLEKLKKNDGELKEVNLNNICGISEQLFCDIFNALKNNVKCVKFSACNCDLSDLAVSTLCAVLEENSQVKSLSIENNRVSPDPGGAGSACGGEDRQRDLQEPAHHEGRHHPRVQGSHRQGEQAHDCEHGQAPHQQTEGWRTTRVRSFVGSRQDHRLIHWSPTGHPLVTHWSPIGQPLVNHWSTIGHPLVTHSGLTHHIFFFKVALPDFILGRIFYVYQYIVVVQET